jgi:uncharacterized protein (DUF1501 family)
MTVSPAMTVFPALTVSAAAAHAGAAASSPTTRCGCPENEREGLSRRGLFALAGAVGLVTATTPAGARVAFGATAAATDVLVVLSMRGGMDGLSVVVPSGDPGYRAARPNIGLAASVLHRVDPMFGLHPALAPVLPLWTAGTLAAVHAVGQSDPSRSHFSAMAEMERAAPGSSVRSGWIDRTLGLLPAGSPFQGTEVGSPLLPQSLRGPVPAMGMTSVDGVHLSIGEKVAPITRWQESVALLHHGSRPELGAPTVSGLRAVQTAQGIPAAVAGSYPKGQLGDSLRDVARLLRANVGLQVATVDYGHWDMHAELGSADQGWMHDQLTELAQALAAFATDLGPDLSRVTVVTLSEFGRRVHENGSGGVDHGHGNAVLVMGGGVRGGKVYGRWPGLSEPALDHGDLAVTTDYRTIIAEILTRRCGVGSTSAVFPGWSGTPLGLVKPR